MLIGSLKILPASILPAKNISKWEFAEVIISSQVIATLLPDTSMFGFCEGESGILILKLTGLAKFCPPSILFSKNTSLFMTPLTGYA
jgi:hypothetical protein